MLKIYIATKLLELCWSLISHVGSSRKTLECQWHVC